MFGTNQKQRRLVREELGIHDDAFVAVQLPDNWPTKATRSGWRILSPSAAALFCVDDFGHFTSFFKFAVILSQLSNVSSQSNERLSRLPFSILLYSTTSGKGLKMTPLSTSTQLC